MEDRATAVVLCAWCGSVRVGGEWQFDLPLEYVLERRRGGVVTHGICPACFGTHAPGVRYPRSA